jgi:WhiB family redox-sensing transcriptional regulator
MAAVEAFHEPAEAAWRELAACAGRTKLFFAPKAERPQARARREAKAYELCRTCAVMIECRDFARTNHEYGYWGGESEEDRHLAGFTVSAPVGVRTRLARTSTTSAT